jgi:hypothetical protein
VVLNELDEGAFDGPVIVFGLMALFTAIGVAASANYLRGRPFGSTFAILQALSAAAALAIVSCVSRTWQIQNPLASVDPQILIALALVFEGALVLAAVAIAASTRFGSVMTFMTCALFLLAGLVSEYFLGSIVSGTTATPAWGRWIAWPLYAGIPNMQFFWMADALTQGHHISVAHLGKVTLYAVCMITVLLSLAVALFQERDVG